jgi:hypothetical protein
MQGTLEEEYRASLPAEAFFSAPLRLERSGRATLRLI